jgi:hypothetical protein
MVIGYIISKTALIAHATSYEIAAGIVVFFAGLRVGQRLGLAVPT